MAKTAKGSIRGLVSHVTYAILFLIFYISSVVLVYKLHKLKHLLHWSSFPFPSLSKLLPFGYRINCVGAYFVSYGLLRNTKPQASSNTDLLWYFISRRYLGLHCRHPWGKTRATFTKHVINTVWWRPCNLHRGEKCLFYLCNCEKNTQVFQMKLIRYVQAEFKLSYKKKIECLGWN